MIESSHGRGSLGDHDVAGRLQWRVANGIGGFAAGSASGELGHRGHGTLFAALASSASPTLLLAKLSETLDVGDRTLSLDTNAWASGAIEPRGHRLLESFRLEDTVPTWTWLAGGARLEKRVWMERGENTVFVQYRLRSSPDRARLVLSVLVNHRSALSDPGSPDWTARIEPATGGLRVEAFDGATPLWLLASGAEIQPRHEWHRDYALRLDAQAPNAREHHLVAARLVVGLKPGETFTLVASTRRDAGLGEAGTLPIVSALARRRAHERGLIEAWRREQPAAWRQAPSWVRALVLAADGLLADPVGPQRVESGLFAEALSTGDWARDALIALPGLALATGRPERAREVLEVLCDAVDGGRLPRALPAAGETAEPGGVDAPLWLVHAVRAYFERTIDAGFLSHAYPKLEAMLEALTAGTGSGISVDPSDGLLRAGIEGARVTWMDEHLMRAGLPPRHGKAVEVNALWYNALTAMAAFARRLRRKADRWDERAARVEQGFARFWNTDRQCLMDVLDGPYGSDASMRPNQVLAVSLPSSPLPVVRRRAVLAAVDRELATSWGLRSLASGDPRYLGRESGDPSHDARAAVLGSAWTWLAGHHALAHHRVSGDRARAAEWLEPIGDLMHRCGLAVLPERVDGDAPHAPRGPVDRAMPVAETLRAYHEIVGERRDLRRRESTRAGEVPATKERRRPVPA